MPWWDSQNQSAYNSQQSQAYFQQVQSQLQQFQTDQRKRAEEEAQKKDRASILGVLGGAGSKAIDVLGGGLTSAAGNVVEGLDWYDQNVVGNVWNKGMGRATAAFLGSEYDEEEWKYENLSGWERFGAGILADPLNYFPAAGMATKALKASTTSATLAKALSAADKGIAAGNYIQDAPFKAAGWGIKQGVRPLAAGTRSLGHAVTATEMGADIFRTLGRPTTSFLVRQDANTARFSSDFLLTQHAQSKGLNSSVELTADESREVLLGASARVDQWDIDRAGALKIRNAEDRLKALDELDKTKPSTAERIVRDNLNGGPGTREVTKRLWETFRRTATSSGVHTGSTDLDYVNDVIRGVSTGDIDSTTASGMLALHAGSSEAADNLLIHGTIGPREKGLMSWVTNWSGNRQDSISTALKTGKAANGKELSNIFAEAVGNQTQKDISSSTRAARAFMSDVHFGPLSVDSGNLLNRTFDPLYEKWWQQRIEKYLVNPFQQLVLGYAFFPLSNVMEEIAQNMVGGNSSYRNWSMGADELLNIYSQMGPRFELPPSLLDGIGDKDRIAGMLLGEQVRDERELAMLGGKGISVPDRGVKGWLMGGAPLRLSNMWSGNARRAFVMNTFSKYLDDSFPELTGLGKEASVLRKHGWDKRVAIELKLAAVAASQGKSPSEVAQLLHTNWRGSHQDLKKYEALISGMGFHPRTQAFFLRNIEGLSNPASRDKFLQEGFNHYVKESTLQSENLGATVDDWAASILDDLDNADTSDLIATLAQAENARNVMDRIHAHSRTEGFSLSSISEDAGHKFNAEQLEKLNTRYEAFNDRYEALHAKIADKLHKAEALTDEGKAGIESIGKAIKARGTILRDRAKKLRAINQSYGRGRNRAEMTGPEVEAWFNAQQAVYDEFRDVLDATEAQLRAIGGPKPTWFPAAKTAQDARELADFLVRESDIPTETQEEATRAAFRALMGGEDPYDTIAEFTKFPTPPQGFQGHEYTFPGDAGEQLPLPEGEPDVPLGAAFQPTPGQPDPSPYNEIVDRFKSRIVDRSPGTRPTTSTPSPASTNPGSTSPAPRDSGSLPASVTTDIYHQYEERVDIGGVQAINMRVNEIMKMPGYTAGLAKAFQIAEHELKTGKLLRYQGTEGAMNAATDLSRYGANTSSAPVGKPRGAQDPQAVVRDELEKIENGWVDGPVTTRKATPAERAEMYKKGKTIWYGSEPEPGVQSELVSKPGQSPLYKMTGRPRRSDMYVLPQYGDAFAYTRNADGSITQQYRSQLEFEAQESTAEKTARDAAGKEAAASYANAATEQDWVNQLVDDFDVLKPEERQKYIEKLSDRNLRLLLEEQAFRASPAGKAVITPTPDKPNYVPNLSTTPMPPGQNIRSDRLPEAPVSPPYTPPPGSRTISADDIVVGRGGHARPKYEREDGSYFYDENRAEPPSYSSESDPLQQLHTESQARTMARQAGITTEQARNHLWEESHMRRMLQDKEQSEDWLKRVGSIFRGIDGAPMNKLSAFYEDLASNFRGFVHQLDTASEVSSRAPELEKALDSILDRFTKGLGKQDMKAYADTADSAWQRTVQEYHKYFTNYDESKTVHQIMRHVFPFWRYEYQRFPRLARTARKHPFLMTNYFRFLEASGDGTVQIPGTPVRVNPLGGTVYNGLRELLRDGGYSYNGRGGFWQRANEAMQVTGFIPGPVIGIPDAFFSGTPGDQIPTAIKAPLDAVRGYGPMVPVVGETASDTAAIVQDKFESRFRQYNINQVLAEKGIHPYEATPEQRRSAAQEVARAAALGSTTGNVVQASSQWAREQSTAQQTAAREAGIPEEAIRSARRTHSNPLYAEGEDGTKILNIAARRGIESEHPEWERLAAVRSAFKNPDELRAAGEKYRSRKTLNEMQEDSEAKLQPVYEAFARGEISGRELLAQRKTVMDELRGAKKAHNEQFATPSRETDQSSTPREDLLSQAYYDIEAPTLPNGLPDWDTADRLKARFLQENKVTPEEFKYITEIYPRQKFQNPMMNAIEGSYRQASDLRRQYYDIPRYGGMDEDSSDLADKGLALVEQIRKGRPNLTTVQALAIVARYDPAAAQAARKALTIKSKQRKSGSERKTFWDQNPLLDQFYGS